MNSISNYISTQAQSELKFENGGIPGIRAHMGLGGPQGPGP